MAQACIFLATGYEEVEMLTVVDMLRRAKISIDMVSITDPQRHDHRRQDSFRGQL